MQAQRVRPGWLIALSLAGLAVATLADAGTLTLHTRSRVRAEADTNEWTAADRPVEWDAPRTAIVICDMWDKHWCPDATERVGEMAPRMNEVVKAARAKGVFIIHCPSDTMRFYTNHPGRRLAQSTPKVETKVPLKGWCSLNGEKEPPLPIDDSDEGCDGCPNCKPHGAWTRQHPAIEIVDGDAITDSAEAFYLMRQRSITNVIVMGVHANMCVLGRPFSIRQMVAQGQNVVLMRDMTDAMYNHRSRPWVSHFRGTELVVEHIEKYWCPSITSADFLGGEPFRFNGDVKKRIAFVIGENEYHTWETLPAFAKQELAWRGYEIGFVTASQKPDDYEFKNWEAIPSADLLVISARRRAPPKPMMDAIRSHVAAGKPIVGIRTASHAFDPKEKEIPDDRTWRAFDKEILGVSYQSHFSGGTETVVRQITETSGNPILNNVAAEFRSKSSLYRSRNPVNTLTPLLNGRTADNKSEVEPVAWINTRENRRVFYTSLGGPDDFAEPNFRRLLLNGILWSLDDFIPPASTTRPAATNAAAPPAPKPSEQLAPLSPEESAKSFHVFDDLVWEQVLAEPIIAQPVFLTFDERGRMWVVQYRQYPNPAGLKMVSRDNFWRAVYDKVPPPPPHHFKGADKITIHEDTDGDGRFDRHKTFLDGLNIVTSVALGRGGVFVLNPPYLMFYPDRNRDDVPDGDPAVLLSGFGLEDTHSVANSLRWGPDGWLYGCQGSTVTGNILVHGADGKALNDKPIYSQGQNIWRYHPEKRVYEIFSEGGGNAFGLEIDSAGRMFSGHNGGNTRGFHYMQGAYLQKGFDKHGPLSNPYAFGYFPQMPHPDVDRFTHNFIIYDSGALGDRFQGKLLGVEPLQGRIVMSEITADGSTFRTRDLGHPVTSDDKWFRPVDIKLGPDGAIYVCDWYDRQVNHYRNHEGQLDASNGRIYRLRAKSSPVAADVRRLNANTHAPAALEKPTGFDLAKLPPDCCIALLGESNRWIRFEALRVMADKPASEIQAEWTRVALNKVGGSPTQLETKREEAVPLSLPASLELTWSANALFKSVALSGLTNENPQVRRWTVRLLGDERRVSPAISRQLAGLAVTESNVEVRAQLACTAKRLPAADALSIVRNLLAHDADASDPRQPLLLWWAIEDKCATDRDAVLTLFADGARASARLTERTDAPDKLEIAVSTKPDTSRDVTSKRPEGRAPDTRSIWQLPIVQQHILARLMRRFAATGKREDLLTCARLFALSPGQEQTAKLTQGFEEASKGRSLAGLPDELLLAMEKADGESVLIGARRGTPAAVAQALAMIADDAVDVSKRLQLIQAFGETKQGKAVPALLSIAANANQIELCKAALGTLSIYDSPDIATEVLKQVAKQPEEIRAAAFGLLTTRPGWCLELMRAVDVGRLDKTVVPTDAVHRIKALPGDEVVSLTTKLWPNIRQATSAELETEIARVNEVINLASGSPYGGKKLFAERCGVCHNLFTQGAEVGPDLTVFKRDDLANLLLNIVNPSAEIREGYASFNVETKDGRSLTGFLADQDPQVVALRTASGQTVPVSRAEIETMTPARGSLMPEGLLTGLSDQQVRDLFAYLRSTQPLNDAN